MEIADVTENGCGFDFCAVITYDAVHKLKRSDEYTLEPLTGCVGCPFNI